MRSIRRHLFSSDGHIGPAYESGESSVLQTNYLTEWKKLYRKLYEFLTQEFQSNWEIKTGKPWQEWVK
jgi:hypothetical protein